MADTLNIFGTEYTGVTGIIATTPNETDLTYIRPQGTKSISSNGTGIDVAAYASVDVSVSAPAPTLQTITKSYTPTESQQTETITAGSGYDGIEEVDVTVGAIDDEYVGSGITRRDSSDLTVSGRMVTAPKGYYSQPATGLVAVGALASPTIEVDSTSGRIEATSGVSTSGYVTSGSTTSTNHKQLSTQAATTITPSNTQQTAVAAGKYTTGAVVVDAVPSGSVTAPSTITGTSATVSTGTNTLTLSKTVSVTPSVTTAGYVSSGTAGNSSVSLTASVTTQAAQTIYPSASDQTITGSKYLTGTQTIKGVTTTNLTADNIKSGVTVQIGDSADSDRVASVTGTYTGGGTSKNVQVVQGTTRTTSSTMTAIGAEMTVSKTGTYDVYWSAFRSNTSSQYTFATQLYVGGTAYGSEQTTWSNHQQNVHLSNVSLTVNQKIRVYGRESRGSSYYMYAGTLTIVEA